jgi:FKBP-type peptidyl-prolyl cis-trans isomerase
MFLKMALNPPDFAIVSIRHHSISTIQNKGKKMQKVLHLIPIVVLGTVAACGQADTPAQQSAVPAEQPVADDVNQSVVAEVVAEVVELAPGLQMRVLREGQGEMAKQGDIAIVHYTGWLFDPDADDNKGQKFDSSVDRDQHFQFPLGAGRVIKGWDAGVTGMKVGEKRELTIAPEMAYGERGAGGVIPPGATLVFDVELAQVQSTKPKVDLPKSPAGQ